MLVKTYFEDRQMEGSGNLEASSLPCFETVSSAKNWEEEAFIWKTGDWELDLQQTLCGFEDEKSTADEKIEEGEQTGGLNHPSFSFQLLQVMIINICIVFCQSIQQRMASQGLEIYEAIITFP